MSTGGGLGPPPLILSAPSAVAAWPQSSQPVAPPQVFRVVKLTHPLPPFDATVFSPLAVSN